MGCRLRMSFSVRQTPDCGYIVCGLTESFATGESDFYLIKFKPDPAGIDVPRREPELEIHTAGINPFSQEVNLSISSPEESCVWLTVHDATGREVMKLLDGERLSGCQRIVWNTCDASGRVVPPGIYFHKVKSRIQICHSQDCNCEVKVRGHVRCGHV